MSPAEQRRAALELANSRRLAQHAACREVASLEPDQAVRRVIHLLHEPGDAANVRLGYLIAAIPGFGRALTARALSYAGVGHRTRPSDLTRTRRAALVYALERGRLRGAPDPRWSLSGEL